MKRRNIFLSLSTLFVFLSALASCNGGNYVPYHSVIYEFGVDEAGNLIYIDGDYRKAEFVKVGEYATPPAVEREGYGAPTWCTDEYLTTPFDFNTPINEKTHLWAKWDDSKERLLGVSWTALAELAFASEMLSGDFMPIPENYMWTALPVGITKYQNVKFLTSDEKVFIIKDFNGIPAVYATGAGSATLTVSIDSVDEPITTFTDTITVNVKENANKVDSVEITNPAEPIVIIDQEHAEEPYQLEWEVSGEHPGEDIPNDSVIFTSSDENIATVDENGVVTFVGPGEVIITITTTNSDDGELKQDFVIFDVDKIIHATDFELNAENIDLFYYDSPYNNKSFQLEVVRFTPQEATSKSIIWTSSDSDSVSVSDSGLVTVNSTTVAPEDGSSKEVIITATHKEDGQPDIVHTCKVTLILPIYTISFSKESVELELHETSSQSALINTGVADKPVTNLDRVNGLVWTSSNEDVATVDQYGVVTAVGGGETIITATNTYDQLDPQPCGKYTVKVPSKLTNFYFDKTELLMFYNNSLRTEQPKNYQLTVTFEPESAIDKDLTWTSSDEDVATVQDGNIVIKNAPTNGEAKDVTITAHHATVGDRTCKVHVVMPVETMSFDSSSTNMFIGGETYSQQPNLNTNENIPPSEECSGITWVSSDTSVAKVDQYGVVTAVGGGDAKITAINNYNQIIEKPQASYDVHVYYKAKKISLNTEYIFFAEGYKTSETVSLTVNPSQGLSDFDIEWDANDKEVVNVTPSLNKLTASITPGSKSGDTYITVTLKDKYGTTLVTQCGVTNYDKTPTPEKMNFESGEDSCYMVSANESTWKHVVIPDTYDKGALGKAPVTTIKEEGFSGMYVTDIYIPHSIKTIGDNAFESCSYLSMVIFSPSTTNDLVSIGANAFKPKTLGTELEYIGLEYCANLKTIGASAFENQIVLPSIVIPANVTSIGNNAFNNCQSLATVVVNSDDIAKMDNPGGLFTILPAGKKTIKVKENTVVGATISNNYTKIGTDKGYDIYRQN